MSGSTARTGWCWRSIETAEQPGGYWLKFACAFLDAVPDDAARARGDRDRSPLASTPPRSRPSAASRERRCARSISLPRPGSRSRGLVSEAQIEAHLDAVESEQQQDGGWMFDWLAWSPAQTTDWRGNVTIRALTWLRDNGRL